MGRNLRRGKKAKKKRGGGRNERKDLVRKWLIAFYWYLINYEHAFSAINLITGPFHKYKTQPGNEGAFSSLASLNFHSSKKKSFPKSTQTYTSQYGFSSHIQHNKARNWSSGTPRWTTHTHTHCRVERQPCRKHEGVTGSDIKDIKRSFHPLIIPFIHRKRQKVNSFRY